MGLGNFLCNLGDFGLAQNTYQRLEDPSRTNPTLKTIEKLEHIFNEKVVTL